MPSLYYWVLLTITICRIGSETITCSSSNCKCSQNGACTINCQGEDACKGSHVTLTCKPGFDCTVNCKGKASCMDATIDASHAVDVTITCSNEDACKVSGITCGSGDCLLNCWGTQTSCEDSKVNRNNARSFKCRSGVNGCDHNGIPNDYSPKPTKSPTKFPSQAPINAPSNSPSNTPTYSPSSAPTSSPTSAPTNPSEQPQYDVISFGFSGFVQNNSSALLTLWYGGGMYKCEVAHDDHSPYLCSGSESWINDRCYVNEGRSQMLIQTDNNTELTIEDVFLNATGGLHYFVNEFCLFDDDLYRDYNRTDFSQFYYGSRGTADCLRDEPRSQDLIIRREQSAIFSFDDGLVEDGTYIDSECKRICCGNEQDVIEMEGLIGWYKAVHFDASNIVWTDASPSKLDIMASDILDGSIDVEGNDELAVYVSMDGSTKIDFPQSFNDYTIFFVNRGGALSTDCSSPQDIGVDTSWSVNTHGTAEHIHRSNGVLVRKNSKKLRGSLCINANARISATDLHLKELIVYAQNLDDADIECIESYLGSKYDIELTQTIEFSTNTDACVEYQFIDDLAPNVHDAENLCLLVYGVHLASIHSLFDYEQAFHLCTLESYRCFLGGTDYDEDCVWEWMDDTSFNWNQWQTGEGCNRPQNNICIFPMFWDEEGFRDCHGSGAGYAICDRLMEAGSTRYLNKTYLNVIFKVCDTNTSRNLDEFIFELDVRSDMDETLTFGASSAECFGLETNASEIIYCYFHHDDMMQGAVTQLDLQSNNADAWCFDAISIGVYDHIVPFDETQCPFNTNSSCDFWKLRSEALAADYYLSRFVSRNVPLGGGTVAVANQGQAVNRNTKSNQKTLVFLSNQPKINTLLLPTTPAPTLPTNSPSAAPTGAPTVSNTHVWITFDVCNSLQNVYEQFNFGFSLVGTTGATSTVDSKQHCIEDEEDYSQLECFMHYANFIDDLIELSIQPISGVDWCFDGVIVRIADRIADVTDFSDDAQVLFLGDYSHSHFIETDLSNQVNEGVILSTDCFHSFYERDDGALIQCFDDLFTLYPYKPRQQLAIKFHTCSVRDSGMDSSSLAHIYLDVIGKERNQTDGDWISMEQAVSLSHFPRNMVDSGKVNWENIGVLVATNADIDIYGRTKVYFHHDIEGILVGIKYRVNAVSETYWRLEQGEIAGEKISGKCGINQFGNAKRECLEREECDAIRDDETSRNNYCCMQKIDNNPPRSDQGTSMYYKTVTPFTNPLMGKIYFTYNDYRDSGDTLSTIYQTSDDSIYIQLVNDGNNPSDKDIYIRNDEAAEFWLEFGDERDNVISHMNIDVFYIIRECEWIEHRGKSLGEKAKDGNNNQLCYPVLHEAQVKCAQVLYCTGVSFNVNNEDFNQWCCREGLNLEDDEKIVSYMKKCDVLNYEMPYASIGSYMDMDRSGAVTGRQIRKFPEGGGRETGVGWYNMEKRCRDELSTQLASIHTVDQNLAARLSLFERYVWIGLSATEPLRKLDNTTESSDDKPNGAADFKWSDGTSYNEDDIAAINNDRASFERDCAAIANWSTGATMNIFETYDCDDEQVREALCSSYGWPSNEYRTFIINFLEEINEVSMVNLYVDEEQNNSICIDEAVLITETLYNPKGERAWFAQNWVGNRKTCDHCVDNTYVFFKDPVCDMSVVDITYDLENMEVLETDEHLSGFACENHNRFAESECAVDQTYSYTEELSSSVSHSEESTYTTSKSFHYEISNSIATSLESKTTLGAPANKHQNTLKREHTFTFSFGHEFTDERSKTKATAEEEGTTYSTENSVTCSGSIPVGKGLLQSYSLQLAKSNVTIPTKQDLKLTLCTEYFPGNDEDMVHIKYIDNVPGKVVYTTTTWCKVEFTAPVRLRNDYACNVEQGVAFLEQVIWIPLCNEDNPALYDGCQCVTGDKLTESACACSDIYGNPSEDGKALIVDATFGWENTCRVLNCPSSVYAGQEVVTNADTDTDTDTDTDNTILGGTVTAAKSERMFMDQDDNTNRHYYEINDNHDIALSIGFVGVILAMSLIGMAFILKGSGCDLRASARKHDFEYQKAAVDSDSEFEGMEDVLHGV